MPRFTAPRPGDTLSVHTELRLTKSSWYDNDVFDVSSKSKTLLHEHKYLQNNTELVLPAGTILVLHTILIRQGPRIQKKVYTGTFVIQPPSPCAGAMINFNPGVLEFTTKLIARGPPIFEDGQ